MSNKTARQEFNDAVDPYLDGFTDPTNNTDEQQGILDGMEDISSRRADLTRIVGSPIKDSTDTDRWEVTGVRRDGAFVTVDLFDHLMGGNLNAAITLGAEMELVVKVIAGMLPDEAPSSIKPVFVEVP